MLHHIAKFPCNVNHVTTSNNARPSLHKKWSFSLRISSVNMIKSAVSCGFGHITEEILNGKLHLLYSTLIIHWSLTGSRNSEAYSECCQTSKLEFFAKKAKVVNYFCKSSIFVVLKSSEYVSGINWNL